MTPEQIHAALVDQGIDPNVWTLDDNLNVIEKTVAQPAIPQHTPEDSMLGATGRSFKRGIIPAAAGIGTMAMVANPMVGIPLAIGSALAAGFGQEKLLPLSEEQKKQRAFDREKHPIATLIGELLPETVAARPGLSAAKRAVSGTRALATGQKLTRGQREAMIAAGAGAGIGAGIEGGVQAFSDEDFSPSRIALATAFGGTFTQPTRFGKSIFRRSQPAVGFEEAQRRVQPGGGLPDQTAKHIRTQLPPSAIGGDPVGSVGQSRVQGAVGRSAFTNNAVPPPTAKELAADTLRIQEAEKVRIAEEARLEQANLEGTLTESTVPARPAVAAGMFGDISQVPVKQSTGGPSLSNVTPQVPMSGEGIVPARNIAGMQREGLVPSMGNVTIGPARRKAIADDVFKQHLDDLRSEATEKAIRKSEAMDLAAQKRAVTKAKKDTVIQEKQAAAAKQAKLNALPESVRDFKTKTTPKALRSKRGDVAGTSGGWLSKVFKPFLAEVEDVASLGTEEARAAANALSEYSRLNQKYGGDISNDFVSPIRDLDDDELDSIYKVLIAEDRTGAILRDQIPPSLKDRYDKYRGVYQRIREDQLKAGHPGIDGRPPSITPTAMFNMANGQVLRVLKGELPHVDIKGGRRLTAGELKKDFLDHQVAMGRTMEEAQQKLAIYTRADNTTVAGGGVSNVHFGAVRRGDGVGLPDSWLEPDLIKATRRYAHAFGRDRAWFDAVEFDDNLLHILGIRKNALNKLPKPEIQGLAELGNNRAVKSILMQIFGAAPNNATVNAWSAIANNLVMGPLTGITDMMTTPFSLMKFLPVSEQLGMVKEMTHFRRGMQHALRNGLVQDSLLMVEDFNTAAMRASDNLLKIAEAANTISGRKMFENLSRVMAQNGGEYVAKVRKAMALNGDAESIRFMENLANGNDWTKMADEEVGSRVARLVVGAYDFTGLPEWVQGSGLAPFVRLARWSIEQTNNFAKFVVEPAARGNYKPLFLSLGGGMVGGQVINMVREQISNKELTIPGVQEIAAADTTNAEKISPLIYRAMAMASLTGTAGILSDLTRTVFDTKYQNFTHGFKYPAVEVVGNVATRTMQAVSEMTKPGGDIIGTLGQLGQVMLTENVQIARVLNNNIPRVFSGRTDAAKRLDTASKRRDLRVFNMTHGLPNTDSAIQRSSSTLRSGPIEEYKNIDTLDELIERSTPEQYKRIVDTAYSRAGGHPHRVLKEMRKAIGPNYNATPSLENPIELQMFHTWMSKLRSKQEADALVQGEVLKASLRDSKRDFLGI